MYRFQTFLEFPDWSPPQGVMIEVEYSGVPEYIHLGDITPSGGFRIGHWRVVHIKGPPGSYHHPEAFRYADSMLSAESGLADRLLELAYQDYANRTAIDLDCEA